MSIETILLAVDGSDHSMKAALRAVEQAKAHKARIIVVHCHRPVPSVLGEPNFSDAARRLSEMGEQVVTPYLELLQEHAIEHDHRIIAGDTAFIITDVAKAESCDLIVMGCRGRSDFAGLLLGSVTHRVLETATCPVMAVR